MAKMTSAYANKLLRKLQEDKEYWLEKDYVQSYGEKYIYFLRWLTKKAC